MTISVRYLADLLGTTVKEIVDVSHRDGWRGVGAWDWHDKNLDAAQSPNGHPAFKESRRIASIFLVRARGRERDRIRSVISSNLQEHSANDRFREMEGQP